METILLEQKNSTFISNIDKDKNFSSLDYISLSYYTSGNLSTKCHALISFNLNLLNKDCISIHNAYLIIPLEIFETDKHNPYKDISLYKNTENFSYSSVTWNTKPKSVLHSTVTINKKALNKKYISIEITDIVIDWLYNDAPNYGITLNSETSDIFTILPKFKLKLSPKLLIKCSYNNSLGGSPTAIYLQSSNLAGSILQPKQIIKFNNIAAKTPEGIFYDKNSGIITITKKGYYNCHWELYYDGSDNISSIDMALKNLTKNTFVNFLTPVIFQGQLVGNTLLKITRDKEQFLLLNNSNNSLQLSKIQIQSSLLISII